MIDILEIAGKFWVYVPPQQVREPLPNGRFYMSFTTEQEAVDYIYGDWPE